MSANPHLTVGGSSWSGNPPLATLRQLLSTSTGLETEINNIIIGGGVATWANFPAINNVNMADFSLLSTNTVSTMNLNVSSINGTNINIGGVVINNGGDITNNNITNNNTTNNNTTTSGDTKSKTYTVSDVVSGLGAAVDTITEAAQAVGGVFSAAETAAQVATVAYGVGTIANGVNAANGVVDLATKGASLFTTRTTNTISGPAGPPGQTTAVYETINGTTQFQFSTFTIPVTTVFRTIDKTNPNQTFGNEVFISTIIPAGTKCIRSVSDPLQFVLISTQLLSTNNYLQSFGQWTPILDTDSNLNANSASISTLTTSNANMKLINNSITITGSNLSNVGQFYANNGIFGNAILVTNNAQVGSLTSLGAVSGTSGSFSGNVGANNLTAVGAVNGATAVFSGSIQGGSLYTPNNTLTGTLTVTTAAGVGSLAVTGAASANSLTITNAASAATVNATTTNTTGVTTSGSVSTNNLSTAVSFISSINGINVDALGVSPTTLPFLSTGSVSSGTITAGAISTNSLSTAVSFISSINGVSFASLVNPVPAETVSTFQQLFTSSFVASNINTDVLQTNRLLTSSFQALNISTGVGYINQFNASSMQGLNISSGIGYFNQFNASSIQGLNISSGVGYFNQLTTSSIRAQNVSTAALLTGTFSASTINAPLNFSLISTVANQGDIAGINTTLLKSFISLTSPIPLLNLTNQGGVPQVFGDSTYSYWNQCAFQAPTAPPDIYAVTISQLVINTTAQVDFYIGLSRTIQINYPGGSTLIGDFSSGFPGSVRFIFAGGDWGFTNSFSGGSVTNSNNFQISQNVSQTLLQTTDSLLISTALLDIRAPTSFQTLIAQQFNASTISSINLNSGNIGANVINTSNLFATNITNTTTNTTNITASNLFASNTTTSSINIRTGVPSYITGNYSNNFVLNTYTNPPNVNVGLITSQLQTFSSNPTFTYSGTAGTDVITLDSSNRVWLNTTLQSPATIGWYLTTVTATNGVRLNISTISGVQNNYSVNQQIANLTATTAAPIALYTSAGGFKGNIASGSVTLQWTGTDYNTTGLIPFTGVNFINNTSLSQSISTFAITTTSNIQFNSGVASNVPSVSFGGRTLEVFRQRLDGFVTNAGNFGKGDANATIVSPFGQTFPVSQYNCIVTQVAVNIFQQYSLALNEQAWTTSADGNGNWKLQFNLTTATIPNANNPNFYAIAGVTMIPYDLGHFSGFQTPTNLGEGAGPGPFFGEIQLSTVTTSTITLLAQDNISLLAGVAVPAYIGSGNITIGGTASVELIGDEAVVGGLQDVNIAALNRDVNITAASTINLTATNLNITGATGVLGTLYMNQNNIEDVKDLYLKRNLIFQSTSTYIADLGHIYGNTSASGGGLAIDYMYGLFFNSAGNDANIYATGGYFYVRNMARGVEVGAYNPAGTGDSAFYVANNDLYLATGGGHDVITNSGRNIAMNAAFPGGFISQYTSTIYMTSLADTYITADRNMTLRADKPGNSITSIASTISLLAASDIYLNGNTTIQNGFLYTPQVTGLSSINGSPFSGGSSWVGTATSDLNMCNYNINNVGEYLTFNAGGNIHSHTPGGFTNAFIDINGTGGDGQLRLINGSSEIALRANSDLGITPTSGYNIVLNGQTSANSNLNMNCNAISNVGAFSRYMISTELPQPVIQYAYVSTTGAASGTVTVTLPQRYTSVSSYIPFAVVQNDVTTTFYVSTITRATFEIGWDGYTGFGDIVFSWNTMGT